MRWMLLGIALCGAIPACAFELQPQFTSFAYSAGHSYTGMPFDYVATLGPAQASPASVPEPETTASLAEEPAGVPMLSKGELCDTAISAAAANRLPARFFANLIQQESGFKPHAVSSAGAQGIAQFMPEVAAEQGLRDPFEPIQALRASAKFVATLVERFGNVGLAAAAYNAGSKRVSDWLARRGRLPAETRHYVRSITGRPAETWMRVASLDESVLPPHARCPGLPVVTAHRTGRAKMATALGKTQPAAVAVVMSRFRHAGPVLRARMRFAVAAPRPLSLRTKIAAFKHAAPASRGRVRLAEIR